MTSLSVKKHWELQDLDSDSRETLPVTIMMDDESIRISECDSPDMRGVEIEVSNGTMKVRVYTIDSEHPITLTLPETGGVEIDNFDYQTNRT